MSASYLIHHYRETFEKQRANLYDELQHRPGYGQISHQSNTKLKQAQEQITKLGIGRADAILAIDGSFSFDMATAGSDLDGGLYLLKPTETPLMDALAEQIDKTLQKIEITSNLRVTSSLWRPTRNQHDPLGRGEEIAVHTLPFLSGRYVWGSFDSQRILNMLQEPDNDLLGEIDKLFDQRFWYLIREGENKYFDRLEQASNSNRELG